jgi:antitoxin ParD1/3/4
MNAEKLSITLPADMAQMIRDQVASGTYASNSEVIRDALRLWQDRAREREARLDTVRAKIEAATHNPKRIADEEVGRHFDRLAARDRKTAGR